MHAAVDGRAAKQQHEASAKAEDPGFTPADVEALEGPWAWFLDVVRPAVASGPGGLIDDDLATVAPWGFDPADIEVPVLIVHGEADRVVPSSHGRWLAATVPTAQLWIRPDDGHISVLAEAPAALAWLRQSAGT